MHRVPPASAVDRRATDARSQLPDLLARHRDDLIERWERRVLDDPSVPEANRLSVPQLRDHVPDFLAALIDDLRRPLGANGFGSAHTEAPHRHARQRAAQNYSLESALREWSHFRVVMIELCARKGIRPPFDRGRISRAVANLMKNALVHGSRAAPVDIAVDGQDDNVRIVVRNEGPAIPAELRDRLFKPFGRGRQADGDRLGLGLYIVRQIVEAHGGSVAFESHAGQPTAFTIDLPRHSTSER
jgi:hypothetical protein